MENSNLTIKQEDGFSKLLTDKVKIVGFSDNQEKMIQDSLLAMFRNIRCANTFVKYHLPTPADVAGNRGILFLHIEALAPPLSNTLKQLGFDETRRSYYRSHGNKGYSTGSGGYTPDPNLSINRNLPATTILYDTSFKGTFFPFKEIMIHEALHRSGVTPDNHWRLPFLSPIGIQLGTVYIPRLWGHDLSTYPPYQEFLDCCK